MHCAERIKGSRLIFDRDWRFFQSILINRILDANTHVSSDLLALRILKLLVVLDSKVLSFNFFFDLFSLIVTDCWLNQTPVNLLRVDWLLGNFEPSLLVEAVLEFVA